MQVRLTTLCENTAGALGFTGEWGLSIMVEAGGETVLLDTGFGDSILRNAVAGGINLEKIDKVVISHGHTDHTGGLRLLLQRLRKKVDIYGHPEIWGKKYTQINLPGGQGKNYHYIGIPFRPEEIEGWGASFIYKREPVWLNEYMVTTGEVPIVTSFENVDDNMYISTEEGFVPDKLLDDQSLIVKTEKGLVVILGCAHRGMVNTLIHAQNITGMKNIYAVVGGTHLIRAREKQIAETIDALCKFDVQKIGVSHCTGLPAASLLARVFGDKFFFNNAGSIVEF